MKPIQFNVSVTTVSRRTIKRVRGYLVALASAPAGVTLVLHHGFNASGNPCMTWRISEASTSKRVMEFSKAQTPTRKDALRAADERLRTMCISPSCWRAAINGHPALNPEYVPVW